MSEYTRENPSPRYKLLGELYRQVHQQGIASGASGAQVFAGGSLRDHLAVVRQLARHTDAASVLDYGAGKGLLYGERDLKLPDGTVIPSVREYWGVREIRLYDPGVPEHATRPEGQFDGVVSTDVLEHIPEEDIDWVLAECFGFARRFLYMNIASYPAKKILPNGWNAHVTIEPPEWWRKRVERVAAKWPGKAYVFEVTEKRSGLAGAIVRSVTGSKLKLTRIEQWDRPTAA
ncbi:MAG: class I SAM-dependent methyltransferase [Acidobacteria bacterium]|nr:class I SAM-dependent methyltransferase [Acidobacteriota bacterium]